MNNKPEVNEPRAGLALSGIERMMFYISSNPVVYSTWYRPKDPLQGKFVFYNRGPRVDMVSLHIVATMQVHICLRRLCYKTSKYKTSNYKTSKIQNVELQNAELQNVALQNVESYRKANLTERRNTKRRILQNVEIQNVESYRT